MALKGAYARNKQRRNRNTNCYIDETLFGDQKKKTPGGRSGRRTRSADASVVSASYLQNAKGKNTVTMSAAELNYIARSTVILSADEKRAQAREANAEREHKMAAARARKEKMLKMEEERRKRAPVMTETERIQTESNNKLLVHAKQAMDEELDDVKHMNQMVLYAKCATIRDMQIREKAAIHKQMAEQERRLDMEMEVNRIKNIKTVEREERIRAEEQRAGAQMIIHQIQAREAERMRQQELREQEAKAMLERIKQMELKEAREREQKVLDGRRMLAEVMEANNAQARAKMRLKEQAVEEDRRIAEYIRQKELREAEAEEQAEMARIEKEKEVARLRAQQEKLQDRRSQMDELRAKRYQEAHDRKWRQEQLVKAKKKDLMRQDIAEAREMQRREKAQRLTEQAMAEQTEFLEALEWQRAQAEADQRKKEEEELVRAEHREELLNQINQHERQKALARAKFLEEGREVTRQMAADKRKLLAVKAQKLALLQEAGVPEKYQAELAKKRVLVAPIS